MECSTLVFVTCPHILSVGLSWHFLEVLWYRQWHWEKFPFEYIAVPWTVKIHQRYIFILASLTIGNIQSESLARGPNYCLCIESNSAGFSFVNTGNQVHLEACQTAFRTEFDERRAPSKCCIQKLVKKLETRGSRSNACRLLSLGPIEGQSVQKYTPHNLTNQRSYTPRDSSHQLWHFGKSIPEFGETHSSVLGC